MSKRPDPNLIILPVVITLLGLIFIYSASGDKFLIKQLIWFGIASTIFFLISRTSPRFLMEITFPFYIITVILLLLTLFLATRIPRRWISLGLFSFQPSELAKVATILMISRYLSQRRRKSIIEVGIVFLIAILPAILVFMEPNLGSSIAFLVFPFAILLGDGMPLFLVFLILSPILSIVLSFSILVWAPYIIILTFFLIRRREPITLLTTLTANSIVGLFTPLLWHGLKEYQRQRIIGFLAPWLDPKGIGWQTIQSRIAFGSGQFFGKGLLAGTQKKLSFLPAPHTDFIISVIGEELGFLGVLFAVSLLFILSLRILKLARETKNRFSALASIGIFSLITYHWFVNIGVAIGILPVTGMPLPFISYGGSSLLSFFLGMGILVAISRFRFEH